MGGIILGFSTGWWSHKHNTHHAFPNRLDIDVDIHNEPFIHLWVPKAEKDVWWRKYQHIYYPIAYSFLHVSWRIQSLQFCISSGIWDERLVVFIGYVWLATLPVLVTLSAILIGGLMVAVVVTCNH